MRIFFTTNAVKKYITKEIKNISYRELFHVKSFLLFYVVTKRPIKIPDFL